MAIKATINGEVWEFETAAEAVEFKRAMQPTTPAAHPQRQRPRATKRPKPAKATVMPLRRKEPEKPAASLSPAARHALETIRRQPDGVHSAAFANEMAISTSAVPLLMMRVGKDLKAMGYRPGDVVRREKYYVQGRAKSIFKPGPRIEDALRQNGELFAAAR